MKCAEDGGSDLASLKACSKWRGENPLSRGSLILKEPFGVSFESIDNGVSNKTVPFDGYSPKDMLLEFEGVARCSSMTGGSDQDHLYFFSKNVYIEV